VNIDEAAYAPFADALRQVCHSLALDIVRGGEGATKLVAIRVSGASSRAAARQAARAMANSPLVKTALHGGDPNWGRLVAVAGRAGVELDLTRTRVRIGPAVLFENGRPYPDREASAAEHLRGPEVEVEVDLGTAGPHSAMMWTCDFSPEYVHINADYRT